MDKFEEWLCDQLRALQTDEATFSSYIQGILEEDEDWSEKAEGIDEILQELGAKDVQLLREEIFRRWKEVTSGAGKESDSDNNPEHCTTKSADSQLDELLKQACSLEATQANSTGKPQDNKLRDAILSHLSSDSSEEEEETAAKPGTSGGPEKRKGGGAAALPADVGRNANVEKVLNEQKEFKDKQKAEHLKKKERDKEDRAKQKAAVQERKDKAKKKSAKVERKR